VNLASIPPHLPFLDTLAGAWMARYGAGDDPAAVADGLILLPTRRAARGLTDAFLRASDGRPLLLPRIAAFGALDEGALALEGALDLPPAVDPMLRLAVLTRLVLACDGRDGAPTGADTAWPLGSALAELLDDIARAEIDFAAALPQAADPRFAGHWQRTLRFLELVTRFWPDWLAEQQLIDVVPRQRRLLDAQAASWGERPPSHPVWVAGTTGAVPAIARLLRVVAGLPQGLVVLPGVDLGMDEATWEALQDGHPQAGLRDLLAGLGATRGDVASWPAAAGPVPAGRVATLERALLPAASLHRWQGAPAPEITGLYQARPADQQEEAVAIAIALRDALERPGARAALVTPDRHLAARVTAELLRFGVIADDSAGEPLAQTPPAAFLRLLAGAVVEGLAPVALLSLLKHPLAAAGLDPATCRAAARTLERLCLRGPRPAPGIAGLRAALALAVRPTNSAEDGSAEPVPEARAQAGERAAGLLDRLEAALAPLLRLATLDATAPASALAALLAAAEALAATDAEPGAARLWSGEEGEALATHLAALAAALPVLPPLPPAALPGLLDASMAGAMVRSRRALRGREGTEHPRVFIWGLLEARLQTADLIVLGGLVETVWPPATDPGPWMSRPMRLEVGLPSPEAVIGQLAHDFVLAACAAPVVILSCPRRRDGAPAVPARWLARLSAMLAGAGRALPEHPCTEWTRALDQPAGPPRPVAPPAPRPPVAARPRRLSVTEIETWLRDPYAIHARHVLKLRRLLPIDQSADAADYGSIVHAGLHDFLRAVGTAWPADAPARLAACMDRALAAAGMRPALAAWWRPRLHRIAAWVGATEAARRGSGDPVAIASEISGEWQLAGPEGPFVLHGRADRIERRADGTLAILDYKTGQLPQPGEVERGTAPQLPLEAAMAGMGAFGAALAGPAAELTYWRLTGGFEAGEEKTLFRGKPDAVAAAAEQAAAGLRALIAAFDDPGQPYLSQPNPGAVPRFSDYAQLARVAEWAGAEDREAGEDA